MALPNPLKRTHRPRENEIVASASIELGEPGVLKRLRAIKTASEKDAERAWNWYDQLGEVHYAISRSARVAGYAKIHAVRYAPNGEVEKTIDSGMEADIAAMLESPYGGTRGLIERFMVMAKIPGDAYLLRCRDESGLVEGYDFMSTTEMDFGDLDSRERSDRVPPGESFRRTVVPAGRQGSVNGAGESQQTLHRAEDLIGRVWRPSARFVELADSPMTALDINCELLDLLTKSLRGKLLSRLAMNGILFVPSGLNELESVGSRAGTDGATSNKVISRLLAAATYNVLNHAHAESAVPIMVSGPGEQGQYLKFLEVDRQIFEVDMKLRNELIDRILYGLDVTPSTVKGMGDANHWSAWAVEDDERRVNVQPDIETMMWALTRMVLRSEMVERGAKPGRILKAGLWYDLTAANISTNLAEDARQGHDRITVISDAGVRRMTGIAEADAPSEAEIIRGFGRKHGDPYLATFGLDAADEIDWDKVGKAGAKTGPAADSPADTPEANPGNRAGKRGTSESDTPKRLRPA